MTRPSAGDSHFRSMFGDSVFGDRRTGMPGAPGDMWNALDQLRSAFTHKSPPRASRGDVRLAVLTLLAERPMHGYQIINEIEQRSAGAWKPSPGSVYPTLQLLADEGLVRAETEAGRKTYSLTEEGQETVAASEPWAPQGQGPEHRGDALRGLSKAGMDVAQAAAQVGRSGSPEQIRQAERELAQLRRKLYAILAQD